MPIDLLLSFIQRMLNKEPQSVSMSMLTIEDASLVSILGEKWTKKYFLVLRRDMQADAIVT